MATALRVYIAASLDGFIAGPDGDLSWLPQPTSSSGDDYGWSEFIGTIGCLLMGRGTYDAVHQMGIEWPHANRDTIVATTRPLGAAPPRVSGAQGTIQELVALAKQRAGSQDVYIDGGDLIRQALDAELIDDITLTVCPIVLGAGHPLFAGTTRRHPLTVRRSTLLSDGLVQIAYVPTVKIGS